jgi:hypothetical protein
MWRGRGATGASRCGSSGVNGCCDNVKQLATALLEPPIRVCSDKSPVQQTIANYSSIADSALRICSPAVGGEVGMRRGEAGEGE